VIVGALFTILVVANSVFDLGAVLPKTIAALTAVLDDGKSKRRREAPSNSRPHHVNLCSSYIVALAS
jgi:hypothetical protein